MKVGIRKRSYKKSWSAMTSGRYKRMVKRAINPFYGRKGVGFIKNPKKSIKNSLYHRMTIGLTSSEINRVIKKKTKPSQSQTRAAKPTSSSYAPRVQNTTKRPAEEISTAKYRMSTRQHLDHWEYTPDQNDKKKSKGGKIVLLSLVVLAVMAFFLSIIGLSSSVENPEHKNVSNSTENILNGTQEVLGEGSKYDSVCKKAIAEKEKINLHDVHYYQTQYEDIVFDVGEYESKSAINYSMGDTEGSAWVCYVFVRKDSTVNAVVYSL